MRANTKPASEAPVNDSGRMIGPADKPAAPANKTAASGKPKAALTSKTRKAARRLLRSSAAASRTEKLVCRYCGSDDLAPSFRKHRDARCRACFKKRYGSAARGKRAARTRKAKAAK
jgi:hypothetical protein